MTSDGSIESHRRGSAVVLTLTRASRANAYTAPMLDALAREIDRADADDTVRVLVITGAGDRVFSAGADRAGLDARDWRDVVALRSARVFGRLARSRVVTIAAINGAAVGGGLELAISCDLRLAVTGATFRLPEPEFGLIPAAGGTALLPGLVGAGRAKELVLGGAEWDAGTALRAGLVTEVVEPELLWEHVGAWIARIERRDPMALRLAKQALGLSAAGHAGAGFDRLAQALLDGKRHAGTQKE